MDKIETCILRAIYHLKKKNYEMTKKYLIQALKFLKENNGLEIVS